MIWTVDKTNVVNADNHGKLQYWCTDHNSTNRIMDANHVKLEDYS